MATKEDYAAYVVEKLSLYYEVNYRRMFGEYMIYVDQKPIILVCDDQPYIKIHPATEPILIKTETGYPYKGAKLHYVLDIDDLEIVKQAIDALLPHVIIKPKRPKKQV